MRAEIVHGDDIARRQGRRENLLDIGEELFAIDGSVEDAGRGDAVTAQAGQERRRFPVTEGRVSDQSLALFTSAIAGRHVGRSPSLVDEDESPGIEGLLHLAPSGARGRDIRPLPLGRVQGFF